jgi:hypothetical protein
MDATARRAFNEDYLAGSKNSSSGGRTGRERQRTAPGPVAWRDTTQSDASHAVEVRPLAFRTFLCQSTPVASLSSIVI